MVMGASGRGNHGKSPSRGPGWGICSYICARRAESAAFGVVFQIVELFFVIETELFFIGACAGAVFLPAVTLVLPLQDFDAIGTGDIVGSGCFLVHLHSPGVDQFSANDLRS